MASSIPKIKILTIGHCANRNSQGKKIPMEFDQMERVIRKLAKKGIATDGHGRCYIPRGFGLRKNRKSGRTVLPRWER